MRGKYSLDNTESIQSLLDQTTMEERARLETQPFAALWRTLWNGPASRRYHVEFEQAKTKLESLRETGRLTALIAASTTSWSEAEWGFPKGRRSSVETELACALRETYEEAGISKQNLSVLPDEPLVEEFRGSNGIRYRHKYWLAETSSTLEVAMDPKNLDQAREVGDVRWCSYAEALNLIRPYNVEKIGLLDKASRLAPAL